MTTQERLLLERLAITQFTPQWVCEGPSLSLLISTGLVSEITGPGLDWVCVSVTPTGRALLRALRRPRTRGERRFSA